MLATILNKHPSLRKRGRKLPPLPSYTVYALPSETVYAAEPTPVGHDVTELLVNDNTVVDVFTVIEAPPPYAATFDVPPYEPLAPSAARLDIYRCGGEVCATCAAGNVCERHPCVGYPDELARCL